MNLGLESLAGVKKTVTVVDNNQFIVDCIDMTAAFAEVKRGYDVLDHLCGIRKAITKYGCTESLLSLYGDNNITFSVEGVGSAIMNALKWLKDKIMWLIGKIGKFFTGIFSKTKKIEENTNNISKNVLKISSDGKMTTYRGEAVGEWVQICNKFIGMKDKFTNFKIYGGVSGDVVESVAAEVKEANDAISAFIESLKDKTGEVSAAQIAEYSKKISDFARNARQAKDQVQKIFDALKASVDKVNEGKLPDRKALLAFGKNMVAATESYLSGIGKCVTVSEKITTTWERMTAMAAAKAGNSKEKNANVRK